MPMSAIVKARSGRFIARAVHSTEYVFPTPGGPCSKMIAPFPLPLMESAAQAALLLFWLAVRDLMIFK